MAKETATKAKEFKGGMSLGRKRALKVTSIKEEEVERVVKEIHKEEQQPSKAVKKKKVEVQEKVLTKKAGVVLEISLFKKMKNRATERDMTISDYVASLLIKDLEK